jgi:hypothetical protein
MAVPALFTSMSSPPKVSEFEVDVIACSALLPRASLFRSRHGARPIAEPRPMCLLVCMKFMVHGTPRRRLMSTGPIDYSVVGQA